MKTARRSLLLVGLIAGLLVFGLVAGCSSPDAATSNEEPGAVSEQPSGTPTGQAPALEGTDWACTTYSDGEGSLVPVIDATSVTIRFEGGKFRGDTGVNIYSGTYALSGDALSFDSGMQVTERAGTPEAMDQESAYLAALAQVKSYATEGATLTLFGESGLRLATYEADGD